VAAGKIVVEDFFAAGHRLPGGPPLLGSSNPDPKGIPRNCTDCAPIESLWGNVLSQPPGPELALQSPDPLEGDLYSDIALSASMKRHD
jgi:hypothetical protein